MKTIVYVYSYEYEQKHLYTNVIKHKIKYSI